MILIQRINNLKDIEQLTKDDPLAVECIYEMVNTSDGRIFQKSNNKSSFINKIMDLLGIAHFDKYYYIKNNACLSFKLEFTIKLDKTQYDFKLLLNFNIKLDISNSDSGIGIDDILAINDGVIDNNKIEIYIFNKLDNANFWKEQLKSENCTIKDLCKRTISICEVQKCLNQSWLIIEDCSVVNIYPPKNTTEIKNPIIDNNEQNEYNNKKYNNAIFNKYPNLLQKLQQVLLDLNYKCSKTNIYNKTVQFLQEIKKSLENILHYEKKERYEKKETLTLNKDTFCLKLIKIKAGSFKMGSPVKETEHKYDEILHEVTLTQDYWLGTVPITEEQWNYVMKNLYCSEYSNNNFPKNNVTWNNAIEFCDQLNRLFRNSNQIPDNYEFSLPTEAQWEYAASGGHKRKKYHKYSGGNNIDIVAWYKGNHKGSIQPVGLKHPNQLGLYDMTGKTNFL